MTSPQALDITQDIPFIQALGIEVWRFDGGLSEARLDLQPHMRNSWGVAHGGVVMTLLDVALALAARSIRPAEGVATVEMKTQFMRPAEGRLVATGRLLHAGGRTAFCEGAVHDSEGRLCAHATGTFQFTAALRRAGDAPASRKPPTEETP